MKNLYAPWRASYSRKAATTKKENTTDKECTFCKRIKEKNDDENLILKRTPHAVIFLNRYPYNAGHILIMPKKHIGSLEKLSIKERSELMELINSSIEIMKKTLQAEGVNVGLNLGKAAGTSIPSHLHFHVLPRWIGDTNFLPALGNTKQISFDIHEVYRDMKKEFSL